MFLIFYYIFFFGSVFHTISPILSPSLQTYKQFSILLGKRFLKAGRFVSLSSVSWQTEKENIIYYPRRLVTIGQSTVILELVTRKASHQMPGLLPEAETKFPCSCFTAGEQSQDSKNEGGSGSEGKRKGKYILDGIILHYGAGHSFTKKQTIAQLHQGQGWAWWQWGGEAFICQLPPICSLL